MKLTKDQIKAVQCIHSRVGKELDGDWDLGVNGNIDDISKIGMIEYITSILTNVTICTLVLGFIIYLHKQYKSHRSNFSILKFIFGSIKCDSMK